MTYQLLHIMPATIKSTENDNCWRSCAETITLDNGGGSIKLYKTMFLWKTAWWFLKDILNTITIWSHNSVSGNVKSGNWAAIFTLNILMLTASSVTTVKRWRQLKWPLTDELIKKTWNMHIKVYYSTLQGNLWDWWNSSVIEQTHALHAWRSWVQFPPEKKKGNFDTYYYNMGKPWWHHAS